MGVVIEVGANNGDDTARLFDNERNTIFAFEPTPHLLHRLNERFRRKSNFHLSPAAVDLIDGWTAFRVSPDGFEGVSSLYQLRDDIAKIFQVVPTKVTER